MNNKKFRIRIYNRNGYTKQDVYNGNFYNILKIYVDEMNTNPLFVKPTLYVLDETGQDYKRVHDYSFNALNEENIKKYLAERIIDTDDLLETVQMADKNLLV